MKAAPPAVAVAGASELIAGAGLLALMVKVRLFDAPPPGAGLKTVMLAVPAVAMSVAGIAAVSWVSETKVVGRLAPFQRTTAPLTKPEPVTVRVKAAPPAVAVAGASELITGAGLLIVKVSPGDSPPPGAGLKTVMLAVPAAAMSVAGIAAVSWVSETKVVRRSAPFQRTTAPLAKPDPFTVRVKAAPPAVAVAGESEVIAGAGLLMVKVSPGDSPPPGAGLKTVTLAVPAVAMSVTGIAAVSWVSETKVVGRLAPFQRTTAPLAKPEPFTVRVKAAPPAVAVAGASEVIAGAGLLMVKVAAPDTASGLGFTTVMLAVPAAAMSVAGIAAVSWVSETKVVRRSAPFQRTTAPLAKPEPFTMRVKAAPPAVAVAGESELIAGTGLPQITNGSSILRPEP